MVSTEYDIKTLDASELKDAMNGISTRTLRERMMIVTPTKSPEDFVMVFADVRDAKRVAGKLGIPEQVKPLMGKELESYVITEVQDTTPRTLTSKAYITEIDTRKQHNPAKSWTEPRPDQQVKLSHFRLAIPGNETSIKASDFAEAFGIPIVPESKASDTVNHLILKVNGIGKH